MRRSTSTRCERPRSSFSARTTSRRFARPSARHVTAEDADARRHRREAATLRFDFSADAFLHHMVRNIVGALVEVGAGKRTRRGSVRSSRRPIVRKRPQPSPRTELYFCRRGLRPRLRRCRHPARCGTIRAMSDPGRRTRVKICGITRLDDALAAASAGADAIGLMFWPGTPRSRLACAGARDRRPRLPPFVSVVGLFVDPEPEAVRAALAAVPLDLLQFHGSEPAEPSAAVSAAGT